MVEFVTIGMSFPVEKFFIEKNKINIFLKWLPPSLHSEPKTSSFIITYYDLFKFRISNTIYFIWIISIVQYKYQYNEKWIQTVFFKLVFI